MSHTAQESKSATQASISSGNHGRVSDHAGHATRFRNAGLPQLLSQRAVPAHPLRQRPQAGVETLARTPCQDVRTSATIGTRCTKVRVTASKLRENIYSILDEALKTGDPRRSRPQREKCLDDRARKEGLQSSAG